MKKDAIISEQMKNVIDDSTDKSSPMSSPVCSRNAKRMDTASDRDDRAAHDMIVSNISRFARAMICSRRNEK